MKKMNCYSNSFARLLKKSFSFLAFLSFILAIAATTGLTASADELLTNGNFETGDFTGWTEVDEAGGSGSFNISTPGAATPLSNESTAPNASGGSYYAVSDQTAPGSHALYQSFVVPAGTTALTATFQMFVNDYAGEIDTPASLDYNTTPNEQGRVDILNGVGDPFNVTSEVVENLYDGADNLNNIPNPYTCTPSTCPPSMRCPEPITSVSPNPTMRAFLTWVSITSA